MSPSPVHNRPRRQLLHLKDTRRSPITAHITGRPSHATRDRDSRHLAVSDAATAQVAGQPTQDSVRAAKVTAVLIKRCRNVLMERRRATSSK